jgi:hypothetical protein
MDSENTGAPQSGGPRAGESLTEAIKFCLEAADRLEDAAIYFTKAGNQEMSEVMMRLSSGVNLKITRRFGNLN